LELFFFGFVIVATEEWVKIVLLPVLVSGLGPLDLLIGLQLILVIL
jgi:hypothetical protein